MPVPPAPSAPLAPALHSPARGPAAPPRPHLTPDALRLVSPALPTSEPPSPYSHNPYGKASAEFGGAGAASDASYSSAPSECSESAEDGFADASSSCTSQHDSGSGETAAAVAGPGQAERLAERHMLRSLLGGMVGQAPANMLLARVSGRAVPSASASGRRLSVMTFNTWRTEPFDMPKFPAGQPYARRAAALQAFFEQHQHVDLFALQEADHVIMAGLQKWLPHHTPAGNGQELCILWNATRFRMLDFGVEVIGQWDPQPLIWTRLEYGTGTAFVTLLVVNVHLSWQGNAYELQTACSPRVGQVVDALARIAALNRPNEPVLICGDFNDAYNVPRILNTAGFRDCFGERDRAAPPTWPAEGACIAHHRGSQTLDWIFAKNGISAQRVQVVDFHHDGCTPSDHLAVYAEYSVANPLKRAAHKSNSSSSSSVDGTAPGPTARRKGRHRGHRGSHGEPAPAEAP